MGTHTHARSLAYSCAYAGHQGSWSWGHCHVLEGQRWPSWQKRQWNVSYPNEDSSCHRGQWWVTLLLHSHAHTHTHTHTHDHLLTLFLQGRMLSLLLCLCWAPRVVELGPLPCPRRTEVAVLAKAWNVSYPNEDSSCHRGQWWVTLLLHSHTHTHTHTHDHLLTLFLQGRMPSLLLCLRWAPKVVEPVVELGPLPSCPEVAVVVTVLPELRNA